MRRGAINRSITRTPLHDTVASREQKQHQKHARHIIITRIANTRLMYKLLTPIAPSNKPERWKMICPLFVFLEREEREKGIIYEHG